MARAARSERRRSSRRSPQRFDLPPLAVEDAHESHQRPKIEDYDDGLVRRPEGRHATTTRARPSSSTRSRCSRGRASPSSSAAAPRTTSRAPASASPTARTSSREGPIAVVWAVLDTVVDDYEPVLDGLEGDIEDVEKAIFEEGARPDAAHLLPAPRARPLLPRRAPAAQRAAGARARHHPGPRRRTRCASTSATSSDHLERLRGGAEHAARRARRRAEREPRRDLGAAERHRAQGLGLGGDRDRPDAHREHLRHELRAHARAALGHRLSARDRPHGRLSFTLWHFLHRWGWL